MEEIKAIAQIAYNSLEYTPIKVIISEKTPYINKDGKLKHKSIPVQYIAVESNHLSSGKTLLIRMSLMDEEPILQRKELIKRIAREKTNEEIKRSVNSGRIDLTYYDNTMVTHDGPAVFLSDLMMKELIYINELDENERKEFLSCNMLCIDKYTGEIFECEDTYMIEVSSKSERIPIIKSNGEELSLKNNMRMQMQGGPKNKNVRLCIYLSNDDRFKLSKNGEFWTPL